MGSKLNHPGDGRVAEQRPFRRKWVSEPPRADPPTSRPSNGRSAAAMEPAGLEQILRELLLPDTERIRRVQGGRSQTGASGRLREKPDSDPQPPPGHRAASDRPSGPRRTARALRPAGLGGRPPGEVPPLPAELPTVPTGQGPARTLTCLLPRPRSASSQPC